MSYAAALKARHAKATTLHPGAVAVFVLGMFGLVLLALAFAIVPPILAAVLWFPALGLTGWALFWASLAGFIGWGAFLHLIQRRRK